MSELDTILHSAEVDRKTYVLARAELAALRARETCTGCGSPKLAAILAVIGGAAACCPDCSTLTVEERNAIRARVAELEKPRTCATCRYFKVIFNVKTCLSLVNPSISFGKVFAEGFGCIHHAPKEPTA